MSVPAASLAPAARLATRPPGPIRPAAPNEVPA
jgi:hypothetical protein